ncbi:MAG: hypothetical protein RH949_20560 [Coleofasciculus sp. A1-SPW-01]|uniref:VMAP-C domain-containing protein n=1 Tax=Coleofasciculus sp. A1-SPW-01 TaxID=3070819 RepID=UPI0033012196
MSLTDRQKQKLRQDIEGVLSEDQVKSIFLENEGTFGNNFYNQLPGDDYRTRLIYAIKELENRGLFQDFVRQVGQEYPRVKANFTIYEQLSALIFIMQDVTSGKQVEHFFDFHNIEELEENLLGIIEGDRLLFNCLNNPEDMGLSTICPSLTDFVESSVINLLTRPDIPPDLNDKLKRWIQQNYPTLDCPTEQPSNSILHSYILILVYPLLGKTRTKKKTFNIQAEFIEDFPNTQNQPIDLNPEDMKTEGYFEKEIPDVIYKFIQQVKDNYLHAKVLQNQPYNLKIELFLPTELLSKRFEFKPPQVWKKDDIALCEKYSVMLRSLNRLLKPDWQNACLIKWQKMTQLKPNDICDFDKDRNLSSLLSSALNKKQLALELERFIIVKLCCDLPPRKTPVFFELLLAKGIPLCFWLKNQDLCQPAIDSLNTLTTTDSFSDLDTLSEKILDIRKQDLAQPNRETLLGYNLSVLCDNTERKPVNLPKFNQLAS